MSIHLNPPKRWFPGRKNTVLPLRNAKRSCWLLLLLAAAFLTQSCRQERPIDAFLEQMPPKDGQTDTVELDFRQPVDHHHTKNDSFTQRVIIRHVGYDRPVVVQLQGYGLHPPKRNELAHSLNANHVVIEHRFFGQSIPQPASWEHLTIWQAATDHHRIIRTLQELYPGKWISTGVSKGGQTVMFHKRFYPDDVDATVAYVAPLCFSTEDPRMDHYIDQLGWANCRKRIQNFQIDLLRHRNRYLPFFREYAREKNYEYPMGLERAYELIVLDYQVAFWQFSRANCTKIPQEKAAPHIKMIHLLKAARPELFEKKFVEANQAFFYQAYTQTGVYELDVAPFKKHLSDTSAFDFTYGLPDRVDVSFDASAMSDIQTWLKENGDHMMYLYGENDPWTAMAFEPSGKTGAVKLVNPGGNHATHIGNFPGYMRDSIHDVLESWLDLKIRGQN